jgi:hypothetical protein
MFTLLVALAILVATAPLQARQAGDDPQFRVRLESAQADWLRRTLEDAGYDVLGASEGTVDVAVSRAELAGLRSRGLSIVSIERGHALAASGARVTNLDGELTASAAAVSAGYLTLDGILARMTAIADAYPEIAQVVDITATYGTPPTFEGRHLYALRISDNVILDEDEPSMLVAAAHHAREISTPVIALEAADRLTSGYGTDPQITAAVDAHEIWIAPLWNPDGYNYVFTGNNLWRKNRRVFSNGTGVDQNRNYPQGWSASCAGSTSTGSETYKGPSAASEAETRTMTTWSEAERFAKVIDYHSYGREVLYGYRCLSHPFTSWMQQQAAAISVASGYGGATRLPSAEGEHQQFQFSRLGSYAFLIETHTEFQPSYDSALAEAARVWPGILAVLERPISLSGHVTDATTGAPLAAKIELVGVPFSNGETNSSGGPRGWYHLFLPTGTYDVRFSRDGYAPVTSRISVTNTSADVLDVQLNPVTDVFTDTFETDLGWTRNPNGTDTATIGVWERGDPQATSSSGIKQQGTTVSGVNDLVTGRLSGSSSGAYDLDGGRTSIQSPTIALPTADAITLTFRYYFAHGSNSSSADYLRVSVVGTATTVVFQELGAANDDDAVWATATIDLTAFAGQTVRLLVEAADLAGASLVEAAVDDVKIVSR